MVEKKQIFKFKHSLTGQYVSEVNIAEFFKKTDSGSEKYPGVPRNLAMNGELENLKQVRNYCRYFTEEVSEEDKKKVFVVSNIYEPLTFYFDEPYLKCSKTHKYVCCTQLKLECGGGSYMFLSYSKNCAIEFSNISSGFLSFTKSLVYTGRGLPDFMLIPANISQPTGCIYKAGNIIVNYNISEDTNMMVAYHSTNYKSTYVLTQEFITDDNNKEIFVVPENHDNKALKMPLEQAVKAHGHAAYTISKILYNPNGEKQWLEHAKMEMENRRKQG
tara:strand:+ start:9774 stop:10595 length:822 start_codon:yes stop_codon:yes gene_type:complete